MKLYFMLAFTRSREQPNPVLAELFEILPRRQVTVEIGVADEVILNPARIVGQFDLYVLKSHTAIWMSVAGILHSQGEHVLNPYLASLAAHNKIVADQYLRAAGIPTPDSWVTGDLRLLREVVDEHPLIIKSYVGGRGVDVVLVRNARELAALPTPPQPVLAQAYVPGDELKVYAIGEEVFGVRKTRESNLSMRTAAPVSDEVRRIALRCGQVFGLGLYGLDVIEGARGPTVIDVNYFPSYKGVPGAAALLAEHIVAYADGQGVTAERASPLLGSSAAWNAARC